MFLTEPTKNDDWAHANVDAADSFAQKISLQALSTEAIHCGSGAASARLN